ncbi:MAG: hypothetical protein ABIP58_07330 [Dehalococcoidia bacterium]
MEWLIGIGIAGMLLICPLMMIGMMVGGWLFGRRSGGHSGHGMMMCHSMGGSHGEDAPSVDELKAERDRLDQEIRESERRMTGGATG